MSSENEFIKLADPSIIDKITTDEELSGLLNLALDGLARLQKNKGFSYSKGTSEVKDMWIRKSDSFTAFCMDHLEEDTTGHIEKKILRRYFYNFCKKHKLKGVSDKSIKVTLESMFGVSEKRTMDEFKDWGWAWLGIKYVENKE